MKTTRRNRLNRTGVILAAALVLPAAAFAGGWGPEYFEKADSNKDGALTKEEMRAARMQRLEGADADKDGFITADELLEQHIARMKVGKDKHFTFFSERFDVNKDGKVALDEIKNFDPPFFGKADTDGDGKLTKEEMEAAKPMGHGGMRGGKDTSGSN